MPLQTKQGLPWSEYDVLRLSSSYSPRYRCKALVYVIGGGGSGGGGGSTQVSPVVISAGTGGGAGGCCISVLTLSPDVTYTATIGSGGAGSASTNPSTGNAGSATTFSGAGIDTMTANGGGAGSGVSASTTIVSLSGGAGGTASGGNIANYTGGAGGNITYDNMPLTNGRYVGATGGGAVNFLGRDTRGGNIDTNIQLAVETNLSTGGGGVGGHGGDIDDTVTGNVATAPGGGLHANDVVNSSTAAKGWFSSSVDDYAKEPIFFLSNQIGGGGSGTGVFGSGSAGRSSQLGGLVRDFGGTGGALDHNQSQPATLGGGSGGASENSNAGMPSGAGGDGVVIVRIIEVFV